MKRVCLFGLGYIGLPTACLLATHGYHVTGIDTLPFYQRKTGVYLWSESEVENLQGPFPC